VAPQPIYWASHGPQQPPPIQWVLPTYSEPMRVDYAPAYTPGLTANERALLQRGVSIQLVYQLNLTYSDAEGICADIQFNDSIYHVHFGWNFPSPWMPLTGERIREIIYWELQYHPEWYHTRNACIFKLLRVQ
jgi:hypothetical protein